MISIKHIGYNGKIDGICEFWCILTFFSKKTPRKPRNWVPEFAKAKIRILLNTFPKLLLLKSVYFHF